MTARLRIHRGYAPADAVVMLETLKIEIPVLAGVSGTVTEVVVAVGDQVHEDDPLVIIAED